MSDGAAKNPARAAAGRTTDPEGVTSPSRRTISSVLNRPIPGDEPVLYPDRYAWYILVSSLDIMLTVKLLIHLGAREVNTIAQKSIDLFGTWGLIGLKFASVVLVVLICEYIGRRRYILGRRLATAAIALSLIPVTAAITQVAWLLFNGDLHYVAAPHE